MRSLIMETCDKIFSSGVVLMKNGLRSSSMFGKEKGRDVIQKKFRLPKKKINLIH